MGNSIYLPASEQLETFLTSDLDVEQPLKHKCTHQYYLFFWGYDLSKLASCLTAPQLHSSMRQMTNSAWSAVL